MLLKIIKNKRDIYYLTCIYLVHCSTPILVCMVRVFQLRDGACHPINLAMRGYCSWAIYL
jgi:hypothetical protein